MVTFDKGGRVPRLAEGAELDARQVGILLAQLGTAGRSATLVTWDRARDPTASTRMEALLAQKGPTHKQTLLLALSMGVLTRFDVHDDTTGHRYAFEGTRSGGYRVVAVAPHGP